MAHCTPPTDACLRSLQCPQWVKSGYSETIVAGIACKRASSWLSTVRHLILRRTGSNETLRGRMEFAERLGLSQHASIDDVATATIQ